MIYNTYINTALLLASVSVAAPAGDLLARDDLQVAEGNNKALTIPPIYVSSGVVSTVPNNVVGGNNFATQSAPGSQSGASYTAPSHTSAPHASSSASASSGSFSASASVSASVSGSASGSGSGSASDDYAALTTGAEKPLTIPPVYVSSGSSVVASSVSNGVVGGNDYWSQSSYGPVSGASYGVSASASSSANSSASAASSSITSSASDDYAALTTGAEKPLTIPPVYVSSGSSVIASSVSNGVVGGNDYWSQSSYGPVSGVTYVTTSGSASASSSASAASASITSSTTDDYAALTTGAEKPLTIPPVYVSSGSSVIASSVSNGVVGGNDYWSQSSYGPVSGVTYVTTTSSEPYYTSSGNSSTLTTSFL